MIKKNKMYSIGSFQDKKIELKKKKKGFATVVFVLFTFLNPKTHIPKEKSIFNPKSNGVNRKSTFYKDKSIY